MEPIRMKLLLLVGLLTGSDAGFVARAVRAVPVPVARPVAVGVPVRNSFPVPVRVNRPVKVGEVVDAYQVAVPIPGNVHTVYEDVIQYYPVPVASNVVSRSNNNNDNFEGFYGPGNFPWPEGTGPQSSDGHSHGEDADHHHHTSLMDDVIGLLETLSHIPVGGPELDSLYGGTAVVTQTTPVAGVKNVVVTAPATTVVTDAAATTPTSAGILTGYGFGGLRADKVSHTTHSYGYKGPEGTQYWTSNDGRPGTASMTGVTSPATPASTTSGPTYTSGSTSSPYTSGSTTQSLPSLPSNYYSNSFSSYPAPSFGYGQPLQTQTRYPTTYGTFPSYG